MYYAIVFWRRNLFTLPSGAAGKIFIKESTRLINAWSMKSSIRPVALKLLNLMPALLLQKTSPKSKSKGHTKALKGLIDIWKIRQTWWSIFWSCVHSEATEEYTPVYHYRFNRFSAHMINGRVSAAVKLLSEHSDDGILPINEDTLKLLHENHPFAREPG